jgi:hypothetical protein
MSRIGKIAWIMGIALLGLVIGAGGMYYVSALVADYGNSARFLADASTDAAILERISNNDVNGATSLLKLRLQGSMQALQLGRERLTNSQLSGLVALEKKTARLLPADSGEEHQR